MRTICLIAARMSSVRLPGKVLADLAGKPLLQHVVERVSQAKTLDGVVVATGDLPANQPIVEFCQWQHWDYYHGSEDDVLSRFHWAALWRNAKVIVRVTGDCPLHSGEEIDRVVRFFRQGHYEYAANCFPPRLPDGLDSEVIMMRALTAANVEAVSKSDREHVTPWLRCNLPHYLWGSADHEPDLSRYRLCVDTPADLEVMRRIMQIAGPDCTWRDAIKVLEEHPEIAALNQHLSRNASYIQQVKEEQG